MKNRILLIASIILLFLAAFSGLHAQVTIGSNNVPQSFSLLELDASSVNGGLRLPQVNETQKLTLSVSGNTLAKGLLIFNTDYSRIEYWDGTKWVIPDLGWALTGNTGTNSGSHFLGTTDNASLRLKTLNTERAVIDSLGNTGIGVKQPKTRLHVDQSVLFGADTIGSGTKFYWNPNKGALRAGALTSSGATYWDNNNIGLSSIALGVDVLAPAEAAVALGAENSVRGDGGFGAGYYNRILSGANNSTAIGFNNEVSGPNATAIGSSNIANANSSIAIGSGNITNGFAAAVAMGDQNTSFSYASIALGAANHATKDQAIAMGFGNQATSNASTALGHSNVTGGPYSTAIGKSNTANGESSVAMGQDNTTAGLGAVAMGNSNKASGRTSVAMGALNETTTDNAVAMGFANKAYNNNALALGSSNTASGITSVALGSNNSVTTENSSALGHGIIVNNTGAMVLTDGNNFTTVSSTADNQFSSVFRGGYRFMTARESSGLGMFIDFAGNVTASGSITGASDIRLKKDIQDLPPVLKNLKSLRGVSYFWKDSINSQRQIGMIAQELEKVYPELVITNSTTGFKSINYSQFTSVLLQGLKEQQTQIENQQLEIDNQQKQIDILILRVEELKAAMENKK